MVPGDAASRSSAVRLNHLWPIAADRNFCRVAPAANVQRADERVAVSTSAALCAVDSIGKLTGSPRISKRKIKTAPLRAVLLEMVAFDHAIKARQVGVHMHIAEPAREH